MRDPILENLNKPKQYWYIDGLAEIVGGGVILILGITFLLGALVESRGFDQSWYFSVGQFILVILFAWGSKILLRHLKTRITYPRTGYVEYRNRGVSGRWSRALLAFIIAFSFSALMGIVGKYIPERYEPMIMSSILALLVCYLAMFIGLPRFYLIAAATFLTGIGLAYINPGGNWPYAWLFCLEGSFWIVSGVFVLRRYLKHTRPISEEDADA